MPARVIHQNLPHQPGSYTHKVRTVLHIEWFLVHQAQVGFVHQRRGLQRVPGTFPSQIVMRQVVKFLVYERD
jgi:hypothetical protein